MVAGGDGRDGPSLPLSVCPLCVPSPPRSYSKQRATIDREYGQVRRCHGVQDQCPGQAQAPSCLHGAGAGHSPTHARGSLGNYPSVAAPCWPLRVVAAGSSCQEDSDHGQHPLGALLSPNLGCFESLEGKPCRGRKLLGSAVCWVIAGRCSEMSEFGFDVRWPCSVP